MKNDPRSSGGDPGVLRLWWTHRLGIMGHAGGLFVLAIAALLTFGIYDDVSRGRAGKIPILVWFFTAFLLTIGALGAFTTRGIKLDRARGVVVRWWGLAFLPLRRVSVDIGPATRFTVHGDFGPRNHAEYVLSCSSEGGDVDLATFATMDEAEEIRLAAETFLGVGVEPALADAALDVVPVHCESCGAPVELEPAAATSTCAHCGAEVELPRAHRALRHARKISTKERRRTERLYREISRAPTALERVLAASPAVMLALFPFTILMWMFAFMGVRAISSSLAPRLGLDVIDVFGGYPVALVLSLALGLALVVPVLRVRRARALTVVRRRVQTMLAARPPEVAGGALGCRECGGPLDVPKGSLGVCCEHCGADNFVVVSRAWSRDVTELARAEHANLDEAEAALAEAGEGTAKTRKRTFVVAGVVVLLATIIGGADLEHAVSYRAAIAMPRRAEAFPAACPDLTPLKEADLPFPNWGGYLICQYRLPLRRGERVTLSVQSSNLFKLAFLSAIPDMTVTFRHADDAWKVPGEVAGESREHVFRAPFDGWFMLVLEQPKKGARSVIVRFSVDGAG